MYQYGTVHDARKKSIMNTIISIGEVCFGLGNWADKSLTDTAPPRVFAFFAVPSGGSAPSSQPPLLSHFLTMLDRSLKSLLMSSILLTVFIKRLFSLTEFIKKSVIKIWVNKYIIWWHQDKWWATHILIASSIHVILFPFRLMAQTPQMDLWVQRRARDE